MANYREKWLYQKHCGFVAETLPLPLSPMHLDVEELLQPNVGAKASLQGVAGRGACSSRLFFIKV